MRKIFAIFAFVFALVAQCNAAQDATIEIINQQTRVPKISIEDASGGANAAMREVFFKLVVADLKATAAYAVSDTHGVAAMGASFVNKENAKFILRYQFAQVGSGAKVDYTLATAGSNARFSGSFSRLELGDYAFLAHEMVREITQKLGLGDASFLTRKVIVANYVSPKNTQILVGDYTLTSSRVIISGGLNYAPMWADAAQNAFYFTAQNANKATLYRYDLATNKRAYITASNAMLAVTDVSGDGERLLLTQGALGQSEVYLYDASTGATRQISRNKGIDSGAVFAENERKIYFVSDRLGYPTIFATQLRGGETSLVVSQGKNHVELASAGDYAVYASRIARNESDTQDFNLYLISSKTDYIRQLTANGHNTNPRFTRDGHNLLYHKKLGEQSALGLIKVRENKIFNFATKLKIISFDW